jgi:hypothetical protein
MDRAVSGYSGKRVAADVPGLGEVKRRRFDVQRTIRARPVPWPPAEPTCCEAPVAPARVSGCPLRPPFNGRLRTGTDQGNPTV